MDEQTKKEYDFFMRAAALFESKMMELAPLSESSRVEPIFRQAIDDAEYARTLAGAISEGYVLVHRDRLPVEESKPVDESRVPPKYR